MSTHAPNQSHLHGETSGNETVTLRGAIVGAGLMGRWHAHALKRSGLDVAAICDLDEAATRQLSRAHRGSRVFTNVETMLERVRPDVLHLCTPLSTHQFIAQKALEAGCHLLIEKPLAPDFETTAQWLEQARRRGLLLCPVHQFAFQDGVLQAREMLPQLGRLIHLEATFCSAGGNQSKTELDRIIADILPHPLSLVQIFAPQVLNTAQWMIQRPARGELRVLGESNGVSVSLFISMNARPTECSLRLMGSQGAIHLDLFHGYAVRQAGAVSRMRKIIQPFDFSLKLGAAATRNLVRRAAFAEPAYPGLRRLIEDFYRAASSGGQSPIAPEDALQVARIREMLCAGT